MATLTITLEAGLLQAAQRQAERRRMSVEQFIAETLAAAVPPLAERGKAERLTRPMDEGPLGTIDRPHTRDETYEEGGSERIPGDYLRGLARIPPTDAEVQELIDLMDEGPLGSIDRPLTREEVYAERTWPRS